MATHKIVSRLRPAGATPWRAGATPWRVILAGALLAGCVQHHAHVAAPSTAATQGSIDKARESNAAAQRYNDLAGADARRIDAKAAVIRKYWDQSLVK